MDKLLSCQYLATKIGGSSNDDDDLSNYQTLLVVKLPDSKLLRVMSRSLFLAILLLALPSIITIMNGGASPDYAVIEEQRGDSDYLDGFKVVPVLLRDLLDEGLIKKGHKGFVLGAESANFESELVFLKDAGVDLVIGEMKGIEHNVFDFVFVPSFGHIQQVEGVLMEGSGLMISLLGHDPSNQLSHYKIVYLRRFDTTVVAMRKKAGVLASSSSGNRALCGVTPEDKKNALNGLEDVYLEPPTRKLKFASRKIKFLPDLLKVSLDAYPRRIFISDEPSAVDWFYKSYPMRDQEFQIYNVGSGSKVNNGGAVIETGVSSWLAKNVKIEDYVVMKADARMVEEMLENKTLHLVDELLLECKNQWAYWQCLALYGKVRDEGIAVHQWWN